MAKQRTRVAQQAQEAREKSAEVQQKIKKLSVQLSDPDKYFTKKPDERSRSTLELLRRYLSANRSAPTEKRKPTRKELRIQRTRTITLIMLALFLLVWMLGKFMQALR